jgi:hypothetical protein
VSQHNPVTYEEFQARFHSESSQIQVGSGCSVLGPFVDCRSAPDRPPWSFELFILFDDGMYIRAWEAFSTVFGMPRHGRRTQFSFHYGLTPRGRDPLGRPLWSSEEPVELRIDLDRWRADHLHHAGENHIPQARVKNLVIKEMTVTRFITATLEHRASRRPLREILGFEIT